MKLLVTLILLFLSTFVFGKRHTISGYIEDASTGEKLIQANIYDAYSFIGTVSNNYGFYSLTLEDGPVILTFSYIGYKSSRYEFQLLKDTLFNIRLLPGNELQEITVSVDKSEEKIKNTQISVNEIRLKDIKLVPVLFGEVDIIKTLQLMPGVQSGHEGSSGLYVRGGSPDQNLILLDGVPVYNVNHLFGFFSVFNADAIKNVTLYKGGFPARFGGRLSSVVDIRMKEGNTKEFHGEASIGIISAKLTFEGPIIKDKTSFIVSGRRTYIDLLIAPIIRAAEKGATGGYYFYDLNAKLNHKFSEKSRLYLSAYLGKDKAYANFKNDYTFDNTRYIEKSEAGLGWGNITTALRWNFTFNNMLFCNSTLTYSQYKFSVGEEFSTKKAGLLHTYNLANKFEYISGINDLAGQIDFDFIPNPEHYVKFGVSNIFHTFKPGIDVYYLSDEQYKEANIDTTFGNKNINANEYALYIEDDINISERFKFNIGAHYSGFLVNNSFYHSLQPRIAARLLINNQWSLKGAFTRMNQYIHLLSNSTISLPTDLWLPVTEKIQPQVATQYAVGTLYSPVDGLELSIEGYYKLMRHMIEYKEGASFLAIGTDWQDKVEIGKGWAYGLETMIQKTIGKTTGWIAYTLAWSKRKFNNINFGNVFPSKYDRRHDISFVLAHRFNDKIEMGLTWVFGSGYPITLPIEKYISYPAFSFYTMKPGMGGYYDEINYYDKRNGYRMPAYHRLDVTVNFHKQKRYGIRTWSLGLYNAYSRQNPFYLYFSYENDPYSTNYQSKKVLKQISLFPVIPSISYSYKF